eukprot:CAMPEP_0167793338 /NCGR_PEP_ID=MMETSP0111_2-20121227/13112_1 /TAXON_ID=91324 /ORGANISM="Lotharella globosa, Strain CCCM811" /LENGTH=84 /DNA_ID=CAMNT_0007686459 /DNA_START=292 /DNA_END=542 /DNA_ORIENTATION=+
MAAGQPSRALWPQWIARRRPEEAAGPEHRTAGQHRETPPRRVDVEKAVTVLVGRFRVPWGHVPPHAVSLSAVHDALLGPPIAAA